jgi:hypothetical protein
MTLQKVKKLSMLAGIATIVLSIVAFSPYVSQNIFAQVDSNIGSDVDLQRLEDAKAKILTMFEKGKVSDLPVFMTWVDDKAHTLMVGIDDTAPLPKAIYEQRLKDIIGDLPMRIEFGHFTEESCTGRGVACDPMVGGIEIQPQGTTASTMNIGVTDSSSHPGFLISGHGANCQNQIGVYQPYAVWTPTRNVGTVTINPTGTRYSDSAFVQLNTGYSADPKIFKTGSSTYTVVGKKTSSLTPVGTSVRMSGTFSGETTGTIQAKGVGITNGYSCGPELRSQILTNYNSVAGDSGAPIFSTPDGSNNVYLYGIHVGTAKFGSSTYRVYSPWEAIQSELGVN